MSIRITFPTNDETIKQLKIYDKVLISGKIFCGRDAVLPKIAEMIESGTLYESGLDFSGGLIFHTAVSRAGVGPTSSNKLEIEGTMKTMSEAGIRMHLGKGALKPETVKMLADNNAVYAVIPPVTALLSSKIRNSRVAAFPELGMEALYELEVEDYPAIIGAANGESIFD